MSLFDAIASNVTVSGPAPPAAVAAAIANAYDDLRRPRCRCVIVPLAELARLRDRQRNVRVIGGVPLRRHPGLTTWPPV